MKHQVLFFLKRKTKKNKKKKQKMTNIRDCRLLQSCFGALRVKTHKVWRVCFLYDAFNVSTFNEQRSRNRKWKPTKKQDRPCTA